MLFSTMPALIAGFGLSAITIVSAQAHDNPPPSDPLGELRRGLTLGGLPVPPLVFRDMGDGDAADLKPLLVTVDAWAAIGSNRYSDEIVKRNGWTSQTDRAAGGGRESETEAYRYLGATPDGLLVVVTSNSPSHARYAPVALHVLGSAVTAARDAGGERYQRVDVTVLATYPLGERWSGEATLSGDTVTVVTQTDAALSSGAPPTVRTYRIVHP